MDTRIIHSNISTSLPHGNIQEEFDNIKCKTNNTLTVTHHSFPTMKQKNTKF